MEKIFIEHGKLTCKKCFPQDENQRQIGKWQIRNDPGAWGSATPKILILGFSKGATQTNIYQTGSFDDIAFGGKRSRRNLTNILRCVGILKPTESVDDKIRKEEKDLAFGSLIRCSVSRYDDKKAKYTTSGTLINKSFSEIPKIIHACTQTFLGQISSSTSLIVMLGTSDAYIKHCKKMMKVLHPDNFQMFNEVAYGNENFAWVHLTHPSPGNGTIKAWLQGEGTSGKKMKEANDIIRSRIC